MNVAQVIMHPLVVIYCAAREASSSVKDNASRASEFSNPARSDTSPYDQICIRSVDSLNYLENSRVLIFTEPLAADCSHRNSELALVRKRSQKIHKLVDRGG